MHLFLVRHGECLGQSEPGNTDPDSPLSVLGRRQATLVAERLNEMDVTCVISSPLICALETANTIVEVTDLPEMVVWPELREGFSGQYRGLGRTELLRRFPRAVLSPSITEDGWYHGDDSYESLFKRCHHARALLLSHCGIDDRVAVVTHGGFVNYLLHVIIGVPEDAPRWFELANGTISTIHFVSPEARASGPLYPPFEVEILALNDISHLLSIR